MNNYYIKYCSLNAKGNYRLTVKSLKGLYEKAEKDSKKPLLYILIDSDLKVRIEFNRSKEVSYTTPKHSVNSILINKDTVTELEDSCAYEMIVQDDSVWHITLSIEKGV